MLNSEDRRRIIKATGICLHENCVAHDSIIVKILELENLAFVRGIRAVEISNVKS